MDFTDMSRCFFFSVCRMESKGNAQVGNGRVLGRSHLERQFKTQLCMEQGLRQILLEQGLPGYENIVKGSCICRCKVWMQRQFLEEPLGSYHVACAQSACSANPRGEAV